MSKMDITFKSLFRTLDQKKKEFVKILRDFYGDQKSKIDYDKSKAIKFL